MDRIYGRWIISALKEIVELRVPASFWDNSRALGVQGKRVMIRFASEGYTYSLSPRRQWARRNP
ncbi:hypothetical protein M413DRAFT_445053 [Hebeloma cylindrosporum]|uniref:Uncharacterized protein n=1 Tax=Hebeloma cylindrosporum TaxID=76867 RepID=A0A0C3CC73_HEBCY|nr:hypothetical protein M413DRAFT_445053 [Hebeloma cylindrosporum h7]